MRKNARKPRKTASPVLALKPLQMASNPYKSLIYGQKTPENREIPGKGREIMREKTGKNTPKDATLSRKSI
jgi:hypothetical protein